MILFDNVSKKYSHGSVALDNINLKIEDGEYVFLVGRSGAGKTTLLRLINRELTPSKGTILLDDWEVNKLSPKQLPLLRRKVGFIFQDFKLLPDRTVHENVALALEILGRTKREVDDRVQEVLEIVHLQNRARAFPQQLSLGEQQRIAIARAIAGETKVLLADEPTGNLDPKTSWEILKIISNINKAGTTIVMATHNADIVNSLQKRVIELADGKIIRDEKKSKYS
jgi:cell division transport system ATP-binding protein